MKQILVDSGPLIALFDRSDAHHERSRSFLRDNPSRLVTTLASVTEVLHLLNFSAAAQADFLHWISLGGLQLASIDPPDFPRLEALVQKYSDLPMDFADACLVLIAERTGIRDIATIDRDFSIYRIHGRSRFNVVLK